MKSIKIDHTHDTRKALDLLFGDSTRDRGDILHDLINVANHADAYIRALRDEEEWDNDEDDFVDESEPEPPTTPALRLAA